MQLSSILTGLSLALVASASPLVIERTQAPPTPAQGVQNQCGNTAALSCCNQFDQTLGLGIGCTSLNLLPIVPLNDQCSTNQVLACCSGGNQTGLINFGQVCSPITV